ncbi:hypothetical protein F5141DRAFT_432656 [Pisolithus sp. B1]|nr:hypothetical protein F5141DRAFT_432656 [Pisolithus sp. B1]
MTVCLDCPMLLTSMTPDAARVQTWQTRTGTPYDPFDAMSVLIQRPVTCPKCERSFPVAFLDPSGRGYTQSSFKTSCSCGLDITKDVLGMVKFLRNILESEAPRKYFAGTLYTPQDCLRYGTRGQDQTYGLAFCTSRQSPPQGSRFWLTTGWGSDTNRSGRHGQERVGCSEIEETGTGWCSCTEDSKRMLGAYTDDRMFSIDLVGAVLRQSSFTQKMHDLGWTEPGFFDSEEDAVVLKHCIARYKGFLGLMAQSSGSFFVPTLDIDLAWHYPPVDCAEV